MIVPSGMTHDETMDTITRVIERISPRYVFYGYTVEDIRQEAFIMCMDALSRYDSSRPLENFLSVHLSNRLKNLVRNNHFISLEDQDRVRVLQPSQLENEYSIIDDGPQVKYDEQFDYGEMQKIINAKLPASYRLDYLKMVNEVYVSKSRKDEIMNTIKEILEEHGYEKG